MAFAAQPVNEGRDRLLADATALVTAIDEESPRNGSGFVAVASATMMNPLSSPSASIARNQGTIRPPPSSSSGVSASANDW